MKKDWQHKQFLSVLESIDTPIYIVDPATSEILYINKCIRDTFGDAVGKKCHEVFQNYDSPCSFCTNDRILGTNMGKTYVWEFKNRANSRWYHCVDKAIRWPDGRIARFEIATDITERKLAEKKSVSLNKEVSKISKRLKQFVLRDYDTGLYNHRYLSEIIESEFLKSKRYLHAISAILIDIDYFKSINDLYGHRFGDIVLKQFAKKLKNVVREYDIVARYGGEEFIVISPGTGRSRAIIMAQRFLESISLYEFGDAGHKVKLKLSIAVASYPEDEGINKGMDLIELTEKILNMVKERGGNGVYSSADIKKKGQAVSPRKKIESDEITFLKKRIGKLNKQSRESVVEAIFAFAKTIELKDHYTGEHGESTVRYATEIAKTMNLPREDVESIREAAVLHDLGKIGVSERILHKRSKLTKKEFDQIRRHPQIAADILRPIHFMHDIIPFILYHHERWDGKGYPNGLKRDEIPLGARIIALADVYQALISNRPYRKAYSKKEAIEIIRKGSGTQFDPRVVRSFLKIVNKKK